MEKKPTLSAKEIVTIMRKWSDPVIYMRVTCQEIEISMGLDDFKNAVKEEIGSVATTFRSSTFNKKVDEAFNAVVIRMKEESKKIV